jgi:transaldolase
MSDILQNLKDLKIQVYLDSADLSIIKKYSTNFYIKGFTSNPSLMSKSGIKSYEEFIKKFLSISENKPVSFEVTSDALKEMEEQAKRISSFGNSIYVKIPICNTKGESTIKLISKLSGQKIKINVTAIMSFEQIKDIVDNVNPEAEIILSIFAGRIADTGRDPEETMIEANNYIIKSKKNKFSILWASVREIFNLFQAERSFVNIITLTPEILEKIKLRNKNLHQYSVETAKMFYEDGLKNSLNI